MRHIHIGINLKDIILRIQTHAYYTGKARKDNGTVIRLASDMQLSDSDNSQLYDHLDIAFIELSNFISRYLGTCNIKENESNDGHDNRTIIYSFLLPNNYPTEFVKQIKQSFINYAVMRTIELWFMQCKPDETMLIANEINKSVNQLCELLTMRKRPQKEINMQKRHLDI